ncbi:MAG: preprotein translocase subunit SecE [Candidatus Saccharimonadales bacterium]
MADTADKNSKKKRIVKNPETFRERALKATTEDEKPSKKHRIRGFFKFLLKPFRFIGHKISTFKLFKPLKKPLRLIGKVLVPAYFRNSWRELKLVTWPSFKQSMRLTYAVLIFAIIFGVSVAVVDYGLDILFKKILLK